ncbi:glycosyltransferase family 2 protein [Roseivivax sp. CAU 1761]
MHYTSLEAFLKRGAAALRPGPAALIFAEDAAELETTLRHHQQIGFASVVLLGAPVHRLPADLAGAVVRVDFDPHRPGAVAAAVTRIARRAAPGTWLFYCYNAEFLFYPFAETRTVGEMLAFHAEERRDAMLTYTIDLYADDLDRHPDAVSLDRAHLDRAGYYALARPDPTTGHPKERQLDFFGGLRWRFDEHVPADRRKIDRIALFRARRGLTLRPDHSFDVEEYNTYSCPWHHNLTAALVSFRAAKALQRNPGSSAGIDSFMWANSVPFEWSSRQLLELGLMEAGQWF